MGMTFAKHERIWLRQSPDFSESWLHDRISDDPSVLGLGELDVLERERVQRGGGRIDMLLTDGENNARFEVELMLGTTDPSHIVRCIEYWDIERRRFPAYDHVAVLVAEDITSRFLNVMSLLAGSIPLVAIQLNALRVGDHIVLDFVKVLDQRALREDDTVESEDGNVDRGTLEARVGAEIMRLCDRIAGIANEVAEPKVELKYKPGFPISPWYRTHRINRRVLSLQGSDARSRTTEGDTWWVKKKTVRFSSHSTAC